MSNIIDFRTRQPIIAPAYEPGTGGFGRFMDDQIGRGWYISDHRMPKRMGERPNVSQARFNALQAEFRRLYGAIYSDEPGHPLYIAPKSVVLHRARRGCEKDRVHAKVQQLDLF